MKIGFVGCGKLGLMVALTIESRGHEVKGYDVSPMPAEYLRTRSIPFKEENAAELLANTKMEMVPLAELCEWAEVLFLAPQTPHEERFEGATPLPEDRADFDYTYLRQCVSAVNANLSKPTICALISTVLPGTLEREVFPLIGGYFRLVYTPQFIAMGTVNRDFLNPEFWLIGAEDPESAGKVLAFFRSIADVPDVVTDVRTAEGIKVFYNTFVTAKTVLANLYGEMSQRCGMNVDDIYRALTYSTRRLLSPRYLQAGMGDGGGCHPRDNIALSWLARKVGLSFDFFEALMTAREKHCEFLADLIEKHRVWREESRQTKLAVYILGESFKPETNITTGSPAKLLSAILTRRGITHQIAEDFRPLHRGLYFIGCQHERYKHLRFPMRSVVIDPFRYIQDQPGMTVIRIGAKKQEVAEAVTA